MKPFAVPRLVQDEKLREVSVPNLFVLKIRNTILLKISSEPLMSI